MKQTNSNIGKFDKIKILIDISLCSIKDKFFSDKDKISCKDLRTYKSTRI